MGYETQNGIKTFTPDNTETELWLPSETSMEDLFSAIESHFGDVNTTRLTLSAEHVHTNCLGYDAYDPGDYTNYIKVTLNG